MMLHLPKKINFPFHLLHLTKIQFLSTLLSITIITTSITGIFLAITARNLAQTTREKSNLAKVLTKTQKELADLKNQDQYKINQGLKDNIKSIQETYGGSIDSYEKILDLQSQGAKVSPLLALYAQTVHYLADLNYVSGSATLKTLVGKVKDTQDSLIAANTTNGGTSGPPPPASNNPPGSGFSQQSVNTPNGTFTVDIIAADIGSTRVIIDTASNGDCSDNCPVLPLSDYVSRSGAYAGINGSYFCPADYPSCAGRTGSFDTLLMNKNKVYFNSANNVYSSVPVVIVGDSYIRFTRSSDWGRDTSPNAVIAMQPLLVSGGNVVVSGGDAKQTARGTKGFIAHKGNTIFIGDVLGATMEDSGQVMKALGMDDAMNLDEGGSTALWFGGYKLGPGRNIPNAVLFVHK